MQSDSFICILSVFSGCISTTLHQSVHVFQRVSLGKCLCVWLHIFVTATYTPHPDYYKRSLSTLLSFHLSLFPSLSLSFSLPLIYIAMTPVSVMPAPCCEFHLSRKTSGDCYANGYVVGLVQEKKINGDVCVFMCVLGAGERKKGGKKIQKQERARKRRKRKQSKGRRNKNGR